MLLTMTADRYVDFSASPAMHKDIHDLTAGNIRSLSRLSTATGIDQPWRPARKLQILRKERRNALDAATRF
jgi:hypothetical protein